MFRVFFLLLVVTISPCSISIAQDLELSVMTFNVWTGENTAFGRGRLELIIEELDADIIGLQEMGNDAGQSIAQDLGFFYHQQSGNGIQIISRYPIVGSSPQNFGVRIEVDTNQHVWLFNCHLAPFPYQPYDLRDGVLPMNEAAVIAAAESARGSQIDAVLGDMSEALASETPVFLVGDFNEPSHLDWTQAAAASTNRPFDLEVAYPTSTKIVAAGLLDSFRSVRRDETMDRGYTWTPGYPPPNLQSNEVHDRIDIVYYRGKGVNCMASQTIGFDDNNANTDVEVFGYNSDHRAVVSKFLFVTPEYSLLTFAGLPHNPGNDSALNDGDYGDRWTATPNIELEFSATGSSHWDTYDGDFDNNGDNNWNGGVGQLQFMGGSAEYDIAFIPDVGQAVVVDSFELVDYVNFAIGHTVGWELWRGQPDVGTLILDGQEIIAPDGSNSVTTEMTESEFGLVTLRLEHLAGDGTDLAIDNVAFRQISTDNCKLGDVNLDGQLNLLDVGPFVALISSGQFQCEADTNQDLSINLLDVDPFIQLLTGM